MGGIGITFPRPRFEGPSFVCPECGGRYYSTSNQGTMGVSEPQMVYCKDQFGVLCGWRGPISQAQKHLIPDVREAILRTRFEDSAVMADFLDFKGEVLAGSLREVEGAPELSWLFHRAAQHIRDLRAEVERERQKRRTKRETF